jgi:hypothetical protein
MNVELLLFVATIHRVAEQGGADQNRPIGRGTKFRRDIEKALTEGTRLIDVHSFPKGYRGFGDVDILIMDPAGPGTGGKELKRLAEWIREDTGLVVGTIMGSELNDIVVCARKAGTWAFLLEVNEGLKSQDRKRAMKSIAEWMTKGENKPIEF